MTSLFTPRDDDKESSITTTNLYLLSSIKGELVLLNKKLSFSSTSSTSRRSSSTPLADRFMSANYHNNVDSTMTKEILIKEEEEEEEEKTATNTTLITPDYSSQNDRLSITPQPLFLSYDPQQFNSHTHHLLDPTPPRRKRERNSKRHHHCCCSSATNCSKTHNHMWKEQQTKQKRQQKNKKPHDSQQNVIIKMEEKKKKATTTTTKRRCGCCFIERWKDQDEKRRRQYFCFCGRREWAIMIFSTVILSFVLGFVLWPRTPLIRIEGATITAPTKVTQTQQSGSSSNVAFESVWLLNITMDNRRNYLTTRFNRIQIISKDALTGLLVGKGKGDEMIYLPGHTISTIQLPISLNYQAHDRSDTTFANLLRACTNNTTHHSLSIQFWFTLYIFGLDWIGYKPSVIATPAAGGFFCPSSPSSY